MFGARILEESTDFIERMFGVSPDGGSGAWEIAILAALLLVAAGLGVYRARSRRG